MRGFLGNLSVTRILTPSNWICGIVNLKPRLILLLNLASLSLHTTKMLLNMAYILLNTVC